MAVTCTYGQREPVDFEILLPHRYPTHAPILTCKTHFVRPSVADGRDLLDEVIEWSDALTLAEWLPKLPGLVTKALTRDPVYLGKFNLKAPFMLDAWTHPDMQVFEGAELDSHDVRYSRHRRLVLTHSYLLILDHFSEHPQVAHLVGYATLPSLLNVRSLKSEPDKIVLNWRQTELESGFSQTFKLKKAEQFMELLQKNMKALGVTARKQQTEMTLREDEVSLRRLESFDILSVLHAIEIREADIDDDYSVPLINELMNLYQRAIEYYSGVGDPQFDVYLKRMHNLLNNTHVLALLRGDQRTNETSAGEVSRSVSAEVAAEEIWPEVPIVKGELANSAISTAVLIEWEKEQIAVLNDEAEVPESPSSVDEFPNSDPSELSQLSPLSSPKIRGVEYEEALTSPSAPETSIEALYPIGGPLQNAASTVLSQAHTEELKE